MKNTFMLLIAFGLGSLITYSASQLHRPPSVKAAPRPFLIDPPTWCMVENVTTTPSTVDLYEDDTISFDSNKRVVSTGKSLSTTLTALGDAAYQGKP